LPENIRPELKEPAWENITFFTIWMLILYCPNEPERKIMQEREKREKD
jgi:hypothetical protein